MSNYGVNYSITYAGYIELEATSLEELHKIFEALDGEVLLKNCDDLVDVDAYSISKYDAGHSS